MTLSNLTTTSYALLGQVALRAWSIYDMTKNVTRTLHWFWPRAESVIYAEMKRLAADGLVSATSAPGKRGRDRTIYSITPAGRQALSAWLAEKPGGSALYSEPLLRVHLAPYGTRDDLLQAVRAVREEAEGLLRQAMIIGAEFVEGRHHFQHQVHTRAILFDYLWNHGLTMYLWAERWVTEVQGWPDLRLQPETEQAALDSIRRSLAATPRLAAPSAEDNQPEPRRET